MFQGVSSEEVNVAIQPAVSGRFEGRGECSRQLDVSGRFEGRSECNNTA